MPPEKYYYDSKSGNVQITFPPTNETTATDLTSHNRIQVSNELKTLVLENLIRLIEKNGPTFTYFFFMELTRIIQNQINHTSEYDSAIFSFSQTLGVPYYGTVFSFFLNKELLGVLPLEKLAEAN